MPFNTFHSNGKGEKPIQLSTLTKETVSSSLLFSPCFLVANFIPSQNYFCVNNHFALS